MDPRMSVPASLCSAPTTTPSPPAGTAAASEAAGAAAASAGSAGDRAAGSGAGAGGAGPSGGGAAEEDGEEGEGRQARVIVCDINAAMLQVGRQRAQLQGGCGAALGEWSVYTRALERCSSG